MNPPADVDRSILIIVEGACSFHPSGRLARDARRIAEQLALSHQTPIPKLSSEKRVKAPARSRPKIRGKVAIPRR